MRMTLPYQMAMAQVKRSEKIVVLLTPEERRKLDTAARKRRRTRSEIMREAITKLRGARA
jgi:predicted transcriptional regulator